MEFTRARIGSLGKLSRYILNHAYDVPDALIDHWILVRRMNRIYIACNRHKVPIRERKNIAKRDRASANI